MSQALFPGWRPDAAGRDSLAVLAARLAAACPPTAKGFKLRRPDQWHATLCLVGYHVRELAAPPLFDALAGAARTIPPHAFTVGRIIYWPESGAVAALPRDPLALQALCDAVRDAVRYRVARPEKTITQPHVTLAYLERHLPAQAWLDAIDCSTPPLRVDRFELLHNPGGRYEALGEWPLTGTRLPTIPEQAGLF